ncbi:tRNA 5-hydroxyuridine modification protein YegQ [Halioxenophilus sp. WMMB6]|uniref:prephenate-dependent tRNA uridine(34) hydroxylase TrhP n=1 Tax=Halioxenophilus sp. WMMB6 TaxID=3073815 RepID=UPI00295E7DE2|nr:tRNA 5-hydroxyuridine modification protein YegQ [Halioxenophilus sp. WMMB6]
MTIELLSPAGTLKSMRYAFAYGADAVYAGQPRYSLRVRNNEFNRLENIASAIEEAHQMGKKFYLASNISPHNDKVRSYLRDLEPVIAMRPDALIMSDPGLIMLVREAWPEQEVHLSVQANAVNYATVRFWANQGIRRVILSRELSLDEVAEIRQQCPDVELEVFVHGALCIAYSGRCLLSGYMTHRDSNQGACTNSCRWHYNVHEAQENETGDLIAVDAEHWLPESEVPAVLLQEKSRPGEYLPAYEDEHGTYIMNSKDLRAVQHVQRLVEIGVESLKIEGRTKSHYYVARTAQVYRAAIDAALRGDGFDMNWMAELEHLANRGYTEGFYRRHVPSEYQNYEQGVSANTAQQFVGEVTAINRAHNSLTIDVKNRFCLGDEMQLVTPAGNYTFSQFELCNSAGEPIEVAPGSGHVVQLALPQIAELSDDALNYGLLMRHLPNQL